MAARPNHSGNVPGVEDAYGPITPGTPGAPPLEARDVAVEIGGTQILHSADLTVHPGELVAIVGPNGAGKSTLCGRWRGCRAPWPAACCGPGATSPRCAGGSLPACGHSCHSECRLRLG